MAKAFKRKEEELYYSPKQSLSVNFAYDVADHAAELLWGQGFLAKAPSQLGNKRLQELIKYNRAEELFAHNERVLSLFGDTYITIDMVGGKPTWTLADPQLNSVGTTAGGYPSANNSYYGVGQALVTDVVAIIWKRITAGTVNFPIKEIWDKDKVVRIFFGQNGRQVTLAEVNKALPADQQLTELWEHNLGYVPVIHFKNVPTFNMNSFRDGYKGDSLITLANKTLSELWHETETNRTRIIGNLDETTYNQLMKNGDLAEINKNDFLINVKFKNSTGENQNTLIPVVADPKFDAYWLSYNSAKDEYFKLAGYSPLGDGNTEKTATENLLMKTGDYQTTKKKRNQRLTEITKLIKYTLDMDEKLGFGKIYGDLDAVSFEILENKVTDSIKEMANYEKAESLGIMSKIEIISKARGITMEEALEVFKMIAEHKRLEQSLLPQEQPENPQDKQGE